jgi:hypothetical protein
MNRLARLGVALALVASLGLVSACQRTVEVQSGTRIVDSRGQVISEDIQTLRVPADKAGAYRVVTIVQDPGAAQLASLYTAAQDAIASGDLQTAAKRLADVIAIQPTYKNAKQQADAIAKGQKVTPDRSPSTPATSTPKPSTPPTETGSALLSWMPDALTGFTAGKAAVDPLSVSREYAPGSGNPAKSLVIVAEQFRTAADAKAALENSVKQRFTKNASSSTVHGHAIYFGTDGKRFAAVGFTNGAVMIALEASPDSGSPSAMKSTLEKVVGQLP